MNLAKRDLCIHFLIAVLKIQNIGTISSIVCPNMDLALMAAVVAGAGIGFQQQRQREETFNDYRTEVHKKLDGPPNSTMTEERPGFEPPRVARIEPTKVVLERDEYLESQSMAQLDIPQQEQGRIHVPGRKQIWRHKREIERPPIPIVQNAAWTEPHVSRAQQFDRLQIKQTDFVDATGKIVESYSTGVEPVIPQHPTERLEYELGHSRIADAHRSLIPKTTRDFQPEGRVVALQNQYQNTGATRAKVGEVFSKRIALWDKPRRAVANPITENIGLPPRENTRIFRDPTRAARIPNKRSAFHVNEERPAAQEIVVPSRKGDDVYMARRPNANVQEQQVSEQHDKFDTSTLRRTSKRGDITRSAISNPANPANRVGRSTYRAETSRHFDTTIELDAVRRTHAQPLAQANAARQTHLEPSRKFGRKVESQARHNPFGDAVRPQMFNRGFIGANELQNEV